MDSDSNQQAPAQPPQHLEPTLRAQIEQLIKQLVQACLSSVLPQVVSKSLAGMNLPAQPPAQSQQPGLSAEAVAAAVAAAIATQKDKPRELKEPSPWEEFLVPMETGASSLVALELIKPFRTPPNLQSLKLTAEEIPQISRKTWLGPRQKPRARQGLVRGAGETPDVDALLRRRFSPQRTRGPPADAPQRRSRPQYARARPLPG